MNKNLTGILSAAAVLTMLAGCTAYDRTKDQFVQPVVKDVKKGMSRAQVAQIAGKPSSEVSMIHARGTCQTNCLLPEHSDEPAIVPVFLCRTILFIAANYLPEM